MKMFVYRVIDTTEYALIKYYQAENVDEFCLINDKPFCKFAETAQWLIDSKKQTADHKNYEYIMQYEVDTSIMFNRELLAYENGSGMMPFRAHPGYDLPLPVYELGNKIKTSKILDVAIDIKERLNWLNTKGVEEYFNNLTCNDIERSLKDINNPIGIKLKPYSYEQFGVVDKDTALGLYKHLYKTYRYRREDLLLNNRVEKEIERVNRIVKLEMEQRKQREQVKANIITFVPDETTTKCYNTEPAEIITFFDPDVF